MINPRVIVFEGLDRSGKTTLCRAFAEATGQIHTCVDRWTISCRVYDRFFERSQCRGKINQWRTGLERVLINQFGLTVVYVDTPANICKDRGAQYTVEELQRQRSIFMSQLSWARNQGAKVLILSATQILYVHPIEELVRSCRHALNI